MRPTLQISDNVATFFVRFFSGRIRSEVAERMRQSPERIRPHFWSRIRSVGAGYAQVRAGYAQVSVCGHVAGYAQVSFFYRIIKTQGRSFTFARGRIRSGGRIRSEMAGYAQVWPDTLRRFGLIRSDDGRIRSSGAERMRPKSSQKIMCFCVYSCSVSTA